MIFKRSLLSAVALLSLGSASLQAGNPTQQGSVNGVVALRTLHDQCLGHRANAQMKDFEIILLCTGNYTTTTKSSSGVELANKGSLTVQTSIKSGKYTTGESVFDYEAPSNRVACSTFQKTEFTGPEGGMPVVIQRCDDLNESYISALCESTLREACEYNSVDASQAQQGQSGGSCVSRVVETVDVCHNYR